MSLAAPNVAPKIRATIGEVVDKPVPIASLQVMNEIRPHLGLTAQTIPGLGGKEIFRPPLVVLTNGRE